MKILVRPIERITGPAFAESRGLNAFAALGIATRIRCMAVEEDHVSPTALLRLRVSADSDPSVLARLIGLLQNLNVTPRRVAAEYGINSVMHLEIDLCGFPEERLSLLAAKMAQTPCVLSAYWHHL
jgi:hypothetical protein